LCELTCRIRMRVATADEGEGCGRVRKHAPRAAKLHSTTQSSTVQP
jgi:hypothetical protein